MPENRTCKNCAKEFQITEKDIEFYKKINVPKPTWCPSCRHLRRQACINDYNLYARACDNCKKTFISIFPPNSEYIVYCKDCWYSEKRDDLEAGRDYDFNRSFFEQFEDLQHQTPQLGIMTINNENSDSCESTASCKDCYLISESSNCQDCYYAYWLQKSNDCLDSIYTDECERCYNLIYCFNCYDCQYCTNCVNCHESYFLDNCIGCKNCLMSTNLRHKQYVVLNKQYTKDEYEKIFNEIKWGNEDKIKSLKQRFEELLQKTPRKNLQLSNIENCLGDYIRNAKNCNNVFHCYEAENCSYSEHIWRDAKFCMDSNTAGRSTEFLYETTNCGINSFKVKFSRYCWGCKNTEYSSNCFNCEDLFGCVNLKSGHINCILNKQYSFKDYKDLRLKIIKKMYEDKEYGEFFPIEKSLFGYNNSVSFNEFPDSKQQILSKNWKWEQQTSGTTGKGTIKMEDLPKDINDIESSIISEVLTCQNQNQDNKICEKNYKIIPHEFKFYKQKQIPLPRFCPYCRHQQRLDAINKKTLNYIKCSNCQKDTITTLDPNKFKTIVCNGCYKKMVY